MIFLLGFRFPLSVEQRFDADNPNFVDSSFNSIFSNSPPHQSWWNYVDTYKSGYCGTSIVVPFWETNDLFLLHITILYAFSIIVRYLPERWHDIGNGKFDHIRTLLEHYMVIVDNVLPKIVVERLTGIKLVASQPGSLHAPI